MYANMHEFNRYWALMVITGHWGAWPYAATAEPVGANAGTYADPTTNQLYFIPEGTDDTFATADYDFIGLLAIEAARGLREGAELLPGLREPGLGDPRTSSTTANWVAENDKIAAAIAPMIPMDTRKPYTNADVAMAQQQMRYFVTGRAPVPEREAAAPVL